MRTLLSNIPNLGAARARSKQDIIWFAVEIEIRRKDQFPSPDGKHGAKSTPNVHRLSNYESGSGACPRCRGDSRVSRHH